MLNNAAAFWDITIHAQAHGAWRRTIRAQSELKVASLERLETEHRFGSPTVALHLFRGWSNFPKVTVPPKNSPWPRFPQRGRGAPALYGERSDELGILFQSLLDRSTDQFDFFPR
jgi:hypothetical protein